MNAHSQLKLPGQHLPMSQLLQDYLNLASKESKKTIRFSVSTKEGYEGYCEHKSDTEDVIIGIDEHLDNSMAEYIAAHEIGHAIQYARGYPIISAGVLDLPSIEIATLITNLVLDSQTDLMASHFGFPMDVQYGIWLDSNRIPAFGPHRFSGNWPRIWRKLDKIRLCYLLGNKIPPLPFEYYELGAILEIGNIIQRANNLGLVIADEFRNNIKIPKFVKVVDDLLSLNSGGKVCSVRTSLSRLLRICKYLKLELSRTMVINRPFTDRIYVLGKWQPRPKGFLDGLL